MTTPINNQWVLGRARSRRRDRAAMPGEIRHSAHIRDQDQAEAKAQPQRSEVEHHAQPQTSAPREHPRGGFGPALAQSVMRKRPRWIDRDT